MNTKNKKNIILAKSAGFCFGVDRAVGLVNDAIEETEISNSIVNSSGKNVNSNRNDLNSHNSSGKNLNSNRNDLNSHNSSGKNSNSKIKKSVCTFGEIIHNRIVCETFEKRGVRVVGSVDEIRQNDTVILRSHGVTKDVIENLQKKKINYIDGTCPFVSKIHNIVGQKKFVIIIGDKDHEEVKGIISNCDFEYKIIKNISEAVEFAENLNNKTINAKKSIDNLDLICYNKEDVLFSVVFQSTYNTKNAEEITKLLKEKLGDKVEIHNTICPATEIRQNEAAEIARKVDTMFVIGDSLSSNTNKLYEICKLYCNNTYRIDSASNIPYIYNNKTKKIGVTAGASTPNEIVGEVLSMLENIDNNVDVETGESFEKLLEESLAENPRKVRAGMSVKVKVEFVNNIEAKCSFIDNFTALTGVLSLDGVTDEIKPGDVITAKVTKTNDIDGTAMLSLREIMDAKAGAELYDSYEKKTILSAVAKELNGGGYLLYYKGIKIFVPFGNSGVKKESPKEDLLGKTVEFVVTGVPNSVMPYSGDSDGEPRRRRDFVGSIFEARRIKRDARDKARIEALENAEVGNKYRGKVKTIASDGVYVDIGGVDGKFYTRDYVGSFEIGQEVDVYISELKKDRRGKILINLGLGEDPWDGFMDNYAVGDVITAVVVSFTKDKNIAFVKLTESIDARLWVGNVALSRTENIEDELSVGQQVTAKIILIDTEKRRVDVSIKDFLLDEIKSGEEIYDEDFEEEVPQE
jgi:4-hydroxy-3-methylbut-2-enyl diphosphate reductase